MIRVTFYFTPGSWKPRRYTVAFPAKFGIQFRYTKTLSRARRKPEPKPVQAETPPAITDQSD